MGQKQLSVTPLASLCLGVVRGWINVASKGKGGQIDKKGTAWTRLPADQLKDQLAREFRVEVSTRTVHRALQELTDAKLVRRQQKWKHRYRRDYWYAVPKREEELIQQLPRSVNQKYMSQRQGHKNQTETTDMSVQNLPTSNLINHSLRERKKNQKKRIENLQEIAKNLIGVKNKPKPEGFGSTTNKNLQLGTDRDGRQLKEVWVHGKKHLVVD